MRDLESEGKHTRRRNYANTRVCMVQQLCQNVPGIPKKVGGKGSSFTDPGVCGFLIKKSVAHLVIKVCSPHTGPNTKCWVLGFFCFVLCLAD